MFSLSWHNIYGPDLDILLTSNCKCHMSINTWGQYDVKNVYRQRPLWKNVEKKKLVENKVGWKKMVWFWCVTSIWCQQLTSIWGVDSWHYTNFHFWPMVDGQLSSFWCQFNILCPLVMIYILPMVAMELSHKRDGVVTWFWSHYSYSEKGHSPLWVNVCFASFYPR